jgi:L-fucose isomerase-like protein
MAAQGKVTFGVVVGNRGFFPDHLAKTGREEIIKVLEAAGARAVVLSPEESKHGAVETYAESQSAPRSSKSTPMRSTASS